MHQSNNTDQEGFTVHCPRCKNSEFHMEMETDAVGYSRITSFRIDDGRIIDQSLDGTVTDEEYDEWNPTRIIHCDYCSHSTVKENLIVLRDSEKIDQGPQPGPGQLNLLKG